MEPSSGRAESGRLAVVHDPRGHRKLLAVDLGPLALVEPVRRRDGQGAVRAGQQDPAPPRAEDAHDAPDDRPEGRVELNVADEAGDQLVQESGPLPLVLGELGPGPDPCHELPGDGDDGQVDEQQEHVGAVVDPEGVERRQEEEVVGEEGGHRRDRRRARSEQQRDDEGDEQVDQADVERVEPISDDEHPAGRHRDAGDPCGIGRDARVEPAGHEVRPRPRLPRVTREAPLGRTGRE